MILVKECQVYCMVGSLQLVFHFSEVVTESDHITRIAPPVSLNEPTISTTTSTVPEVSTV